MAGKQSQRDERPGCLGQLLAALGLAPARQQPETGPLPYRLKSGLLSKGEAAFGRVLIAAVGDEVMICPKVGLGDLFSVKGAGSDFRSYRNRIDRRHVDFLLCDRRTFAPLAGVELDDASHDEDRRQERDEFVDRVYAAAGLPLLHVRAAASYDVGELAARLAVEAGIEPPAALAPGAAPPTAAPLPVAAAPPCCPTCGQEMVLRTVKRQGPHLGKQFWGCAGYPRCRGVREYRP